MKQREAGISKGVSEPVYPNDIIGDRALMGADLAAFGAWMKFLLHCWRERQHSLTETLEGWSAVWNVDITEVERILGVIKTRKIGDVKHKCNDLVTLTCRRLQRRANERDRTSARVKKHRCNAAVTSLYSLPSSSSSSSSSSSRLKKREREVVGSSTDPARARPPIDEQQAASRPSLSTDASHTGARKPKRASTKKPGPDVWGWWVDANRDAGQPDPVKIGPDLGAARELGKLVASGQIHADDLRQFMAAFLADDDGFLAKQGHPLRLLTGRLNGYRQCKAASEPPPLDPAYVERMERDAEAALETVTAALREKGVRA